MVASSNRAPTEVGLCIIFSYCPFCQSKCGDRKLHIWEGLATTNSPMLYLFVTQLQKMSLLNINT
jgi:hypothetical protein